MSFQQAKKPSMSDEYIIVDFQDNYFSILSTTVMNRKTVYKKVPTTPPLKLQCHSTYYLAGSYLTRPCRTDSSYETSSPLFQLLLSSC